MRGVRLNRKNADRRSRLSGMTLGRKAGTSRVPRFTKLTLAALVAAIAACGRTKLVAPGPIHLDTTPREIVFVEPVRAGDKRRELCLEFHPPGGSLQASKVHVSCSRRQALGRLGTSPPSTDAARRLSVSSKAQAHRALIPVRMKCSIIGGSSCPPMCRSLSARFGGGWTTERRLSVRPNTCVQPTTAAVKMSPRG